MKSSVFPNRHLLSRREDLFFPPSFIIGYITAFRQANASALILFTSISREQPTFLPTKKTKQQTPFTVLSKGAQPSILAGRRPACPAFQQPMKPATSSFLSIAILARVRSKSLKDMSHAATLALRPNASVRGPSRSSCPWL